MRSSSCRRRLLYLNYNPDADFRFPCVENLTHLQLTTFGSGSSLAPLTGLHDLKEISIFATSPLQEILVSPAAQLTSILVGGFLVRPAA